MAGKLVAASESLDISYNGICCETHSEAANHSITRNSAEGNHHDREPNHFQHQDRGSSER